MNGKTDARGHDKITERLQELQRLYPKLRFSDFLCGELGNIVNRAEATAPYIVLRKNGTGLTYKEVLGLSLDGLTLADNPTFHFVTESQGGYSTSLDLLTPNNDGFITVGKTLTGEGDIIFRINEGGDCVVRTVNPGLKLYQPILAAHEYVETQLRREAPGFFEGTSQVRGKVPIYDKPLASFMQQSLERILSNYRND